MLHCRRGCAQKTKYEYNRLNQWLGVFSREIGENKYYFVCARTVLNTNEKTINDGLGFRIVTRSLVVSYKGEISSNNQNDLELMTKYIPSSEGGSSVSTTESLNIGLNGSGTISTDSAGITFGLSVSGGVSSTVNKTSIILTPSANLSQKTMNFNFALTNTYSRKVNGDSPYRGDLIRNTVTIYKVKNYKSKRESNTEISFTVSATGTSQKFGLGLFDACKGYEIGVSTTENPMKFKI